MKPAQHSGDCTIYSSLINNRFEDGICTCGYGLQVMRDTGGDKRELYSKELVDFSKAMESRDDSKLVEKIGGE